MLILFEHQRGPWMNCKNCGAPMILVRDRDYFICEYCDSFHFPSESPDGIRILDESPDNVICPVCHIKLHRASIDRYPGLHCEKCRGTLIDQSSFGEIVKYRRARSTRPPARPQPLNQREFERQTGCPYCGATMDAHPYYGPGNIVVDTCRDCRVIWLDYGELAKVINAPGRDRER